MTKSTNPKTPKVPKSKLPAVELIDFMTPRGMKKSTLTSKVIKLPAPELKPQRYFKVLHEFNKHFNLTYIENAWNTDINPYNPTGSCQEGGLYFTTIENIFHFLDYGNGIVEILDYKDDKGNKTFHEESLKMKSHSIQLGQKKPFSKRLFKYLIENGANPNSISEDKICPLQKLLGNGHNDTAKMLLEVGADPTDHYTHDILFSLIDGYIYHKSLTLLLKYYTPDQFEYFLSLCKSKQNVYALSYFIEHPTTLPKHLTHFQPKINTILKYIKFPYEITRK